MIPARLRSQVIIVAALLIFFAPALAGRRYFSPGDIVRMWAPFNTPGAPSLISNPLLVDIVTQIEPWLKLSRRELLNGFLPLWNPYAGAGVPLFANLQSAVLFPLNAAFYLLPWRIALYAAPFLKLYLIFLFTYLYLRSLGLNRTASLFGGMNFAFLGFNVFWLKWPLSNLMIFLPLLLLFAERFGRREAGRWTPALLSLSVGAAALAGHVETLFHILVIATVYLLWRMSSSELSRRQRAGRVFLFAACVLTGLGIAGAQLAPFLEYMYQSTAYATRTAHAASPYYLPLPAAILNLIPDFYGNPSHHNYFSTITNYCMSAGGFASVTTVFLAVSALFSPARRNRNLWFYLCLAALCFCVAYKREPVYRLVTALPLFDVADNSRLVFCLGFSLCVMASFFVHSLTERAAWTPRPAAVSMIYLAVLAVAATAAVYNKHYSAWLGAPFRFSHNLPPTVLFLAFLTLTALLLLSCRAGRLTRARCAAYLWVLVFLQTAVHAMGFNPSVPRNQYYPRPPALRFLKKDTSPHRCLFMGHSFIPNLGTWYGIQEPRSYDAMGIKTYRDFQSAAGDFEGIAQLVTRFDEGLVNFLNIKYIICPADFDPGTTMRAVDPARYPLAYADRSVRIYRNLGCLPRAFLVPRVRVADRAAEAPRELPRLDLRREALVTDADIPLWDAGELRSSTCRVTRYRPREVAISLRAGAPCYLILGDSFFPGWKAFLDGRETRIYRANVCFRLVPIPSAGEHEIVFRYAPASLAIGLWISLVSCAATLLIALARGRRRAARELMTPLNLLLVLSCGMLVALVCAQSVVFGSVRGNSHYPYLRGITPLPFFVFLVIAPLLVFLARVSEDHISRFPARIICLLLVAGSFIQLLIRSLYPFPLGTIVWSDMANSFYHPALSYRLHDLLANYTGIASRLPLHAGTNMPGKILLFSLLGTATRSPQAMGCLVILLSNAGGVLVYLIAKRLFTNERAALYSLLLYLFIPARIFFFPIPNTVTPLFILAAFLLFLRHLDRRSRLPLLLLGPCLYATMLFEPLPLAMGILFAAFLVRYYRLQGFTAAHLLGVIGVPLASFLLTHVIARAVLGFDILGALLYVARDAVDFNARAARGYGAWLIPNLKDFLINAGCAPSVLFLVAIGGVARRSARALRQGTGGATAGEIIFEPASLAAISVLLILILLDIIGMNRGETIRLWIFLMVFVQMSAAQLCAAGRGRVTLYIALLSSVLQALVCVSMVGFVYP